MTQNRALELIAQAKAECWKKLDLSGMELEELPAAIGGLTQLETLVLGKTRGVGGAVGNSLTRLPSEIGQLKSLTTLSLSKNKLSELPHEFSQLTSLTTLDLSSNRL